MKTVIAGSRDIEDIYEVNKIINDQVAKGLCITEVVCGMARGVDWIGHCWARMNNIPVKEFPADWKKYGKAAGPIRNGEMAVYADQALVIHNGSKGSRHMVMKMKQLNKPVVVVEWGKV